MIRFLALEGIDGSGKSTQIKLLIEYLSNCNVPYKYIHFPRSGEGIFGKMVAKFLQGEYGPVDEVNPYLVALIYAGDRNDAKHIIKKWIRNNLLVIADRYVFSNIAFQCAKVKDIVSQKKLQEWIFFLEYSYYKIPKPDISIYLDVTIEFAERELKKTRVGRERQYLEGEKDIHESNLILQRKVKKEYLRLTTEYDDLIMVNCIGKDGAMMDQQTIHNKIIDILTIEERNRF